MSNVHLSIDAVKLDPNSKDPKHLKLIEFLNTQEFKDLRKKSKDNPTPHSKDPKHLNTRIWGVK